MDQEDFHIKGYHIFRGIFVPDEMAQVRHAVEEIISLSATPDSLIWQNAYAISDLKPHRNPGISQEETKGVPFIIGELPRWSETLKAFVCHEKLWDMAAQVLGTDDIIYHFSNVTRKPPFIGPNLSWHRDYPNQYICPKNAAHFFRALIPLEGMDEENGCTKVIPGTHQISDELALCLDQRRERDFDSRDAIPLIAEPGDAIAIHSKVAHGGKENRSNRERNLLVVQLGVQTGDYLFLHNELFTGMQRHGILKSKT